MKKYGYAKTVIFPGNGDLVAALQLYKIELVEYWPNYDPESGEPSMPADGIANREWAIYVDWDDYGKRWFYPPDSSLAHFLSEERISQEGPRGKQEIKRLLDPLLQAEKEGLFEPSSLAVVHSAFSHRYISPESEEEITEAIDLIEQNMANAGITLPQETLNSNFMMYPLYAAILTPEQIPNH